MTQLLISLIGGNLLLGVVQLYQVFVTKRKANAEADDIFVDTATQIITLLREESQRKDDKIASLEARIAALEAKYGGDV